MVSQWVRTLINSRGWDLRRYRPFYELIEQHGFNLVFDVGGNRGQFGQTLRQSAYRGKIVSFEPVEKAFRLLEGVSKDDNQWIVRRIALGSAEGELELKIYGSDDFSSFKTLLGDQTQLAESKKVAVQRLDEIAQEWLEPGAKALLKIDTQGFEKEVLAGSENVLHQIDGILLETSLTPMYEGQWLVEEAFSWLRARKFHPHTLKRGYVEGDRDMEYDVLFLRH